MTVFGEFHVPVFQLSKFNGKLSRLMSESYTLDQYVLDDLKFLNEFGRLLHSGADIHQLMLIY